MARFKIPPKTPIENADGETMFFVVADLGECGLVLQDMKGMCDIYDRSEIVSEKHYYLSNVDQMKLTD